MEHPELRIMIGNNNIGEIEVGDILYTPEHRGFKVVNLYKEIEGYFDVERGSSGQLLKRISISPFLYFMKGKVTSWRERMRCLR